eukprot:SAG31_NODE_18177_length_644_cov_1.436697_1_plen_142_part_00
MSLLTFRCCCFYQMWHNVLLRRFFTFSCALMLKLNLAGEWLTDGFFDGCMVLSNAVVGAVPATWAVWHSTAVMIANVKEVLDTLKQAMPSSKPSRFRTFAKLLMANRKEVQQLLKHLQTLLGELEDFNEQTHTYADDSEDA